MSIVFASDHGSHFRTRNKDSHLNGYDDYKRSCHDACLRVPLVIAGGAFKGGIRVKELVSTESLPKTILALAGVDVGEAMIGENLLDVARKRNPDRPDEIYAQISESRVGRVIRAQEYKYAIYAPGIGGGEAAGARVYADDFLYNLMDDPFELNNLIEDPAWDFIKDELRNKLLGWIERTEGFRPVMIN